jgi:hypothetical protein
MKRLALMLGAALAAGALAVSAFADTAPPTVTPFPLGKSIDVFVSGTTVYAPDAAAPAKPGAQSNFFTPGMSVVFRAYAVDTKTGKVLTPAETKYAYVSIPNQPNLQLHFTKAGTGAARTSLWSATWAIPSVYPLGMVPFVIHFRTNTNRYGLFYQAPVAAAQLTVIAAL